MVAHAGCFSCAVARTLGLVSGVFTNSPKDRCGGECHSSQTMLRDSYNSLLASEIITHCSGSGLSAGVKCLCGHGDFSSGLAVRSLDSWVRGCPRSSGGCSIGDELFGYVF